MFMTSFFFSHKIFFQTKQLENSFNQSKTTNQFKQQGITIVLTLN